MEMDHAIQSPLACYRRDELIFTQTSLVQYQRADGSEAWGVDAEFEVDHEWAIVNSCSYTVVRDGVLRINPASSK